MADLAPVTLTLIVFILGASIGSFLNVVVYRLPAQISLLFPPSRCPQCHHRLQVYDNVPVFGWLWLRGRCRYCRHPISARYPLVEAATGLLFVAVFWLVGQPLPTVGYWVFVSWLLALSLIDLDTMTLPNALTQSGLMMGLLFQAIAGWSDGALVGAAQFLMMGVIGAVVGIWLFDLITLVGSAIYGQTVMGGGDAKLAAMMGVWLGWANLLLAGFLACAVGAVVGGGGVALGLINRRQPIPFGPFLAIGAVIAAFFGDDLIAAYLGIFFPTIGGNP
ncbi:MAG: prepilin peptidase [Synechococcales bacterium]|nr:prepilin peptidase [Synechococcales bacterium]